MKAIAKRMSAMFTLVMRSCSSILFRFAAHGFSNPISTTDWKRFEKWFFEYFSDTVPSILMEIQLERLACEPIVVSKILKFIDNEEKYYCLSQQKKLSDGSTFESPTRLTLSLLNTLLSVGRSRDRIYAKQLLQQFIIHNLKTNEIPYKQNR